MLGTLVEHAEPFRDIRTDHARRGNRRTRTQLIKRDRWGEIAEVSRYTPIVGRSYLDVGRTVERDRLRKLVVAKYSPNLPVREVPNTSP